MKLFFSLIGLSQLITPFFTSCVMFGITSDFHQINTLTFIYILKYSLFLSKFSKFSYKSFLLKDLQINSKRK